MDGILPLWKEKGMTSHDCVFKLRKILGIKKIGHAGTLDPDVDGVLPIAVGKGTKVIEYMMNSEKTYTGEITLGLSTTTEDASGETVHQTEMLPSSVHLSEIDQAIKEMTGEQIQVPPMYSAVKVEGKKLYEYARAGQEVERPERTITIRSFGRTSEPKFNEDQKTISFKFKVECSKGTYVRTLAVDLGKKLGFPSHMSQLTRTHSAEMDADMSVTLKEVKNLFETGRLDTVMKPIETVLSEMNSYTLSEEEWGKVKDGAVLEYENYLDVNFPAVFYYKDAAVAIYIVHPSKPHLIKPQKLLRREMQV